LAPGDKEPLPEIIITKHIKSYIKVYTSTLPKIFWHFTVYILPLKTVGMAGLCVSSLFHNQVMELLISNRELS
jgi:hypothetical protein